MKRPIYLDHQATTPLDTRVFEAMKPFMLEEFGNPSSSTHAYGWTAAKAVETAREQVAHLFDVAPKDVVFTASATEGNNAALFGLFQSYGATKNHFITTQTEHKSVLEVMKELERRGASVTYLPVDHFGRITAKQIEQATTDKTLAVSVIFANNEIGTINPIGEICELTQSKGVFFHSDATQAVGKFPLENFNVDLLTFSAHKIHGPKGVGALVVRSKSPRTKLTPLIFGAGQELGLRSGTLNVPGIVGLGKACEILRNEMEADCQRMKALSQQLQKGLSQLSGAEFNGHPTERIPSNLSLTIPGIDRKAVLARLHPHVALSTGSACTSDSGQVSHVLKAIGLSDERARQTFRIGIGRFTTENEVTAALEKILQCVDNRPGLR